MRAGWLRDLVKVERPETVKDATGSIAKTWIEVAQVRAQIQFMSGGESFGTGQPVAETTVRIRMRRFPQDPDLNPAWRIIDARRGDVFEIVDIIPTRYRNDLTLQCRRGGVVRS